LIEQNRSDLLEIGFYRQQVKVMAVENFLKNRREYIRKDINAKDKYGHVSPVFSYGGKKKGIKSEKGGYQDRVGDDRQDQPGIRGKKLKVPGKYQLEEDEHDPWDQRHDKQEEKDDGCLACQIIPLFKRAGKVELESIVLEVIGDQACSTKNQDHDDHEQQKIIGEIGLKIGGIHV
jgi:hypothetical protein